MILQKYDNGIRIVDSDENEIYRQEGAWTFPSDEVSDNVFDEINKTMDGANIGNPQREALLKCFGLIGALFGDIEREQIDGDLP